MKTKYFFIAVAGALLSMPNVFAQNANQEEGKPVRTERRMVIVKNGERMEFNEAGFDFKKGRERMKEVQVDQVINALMLNDATAAKFKVTYEKYLKELAEAHTIGMKKNVEEAKEQAKMEEPRAPLTDAQIEEGIKNRFEQSRKILDVREKYFNEFKKQLTPKQILKVYELEKNNHQKIQKEFSKRMRDDKDGGRQKMRMERQEKSEMNQNSDKVQKTEVKS